MVLFAFIFLITYKELNNKITIFVSILFSTLSAQLSGTILFEAIYYPYFLDLEFFKYIWMITTVIYPVERFIIALIANFLIYPIDKLIKNYLGTYLHLDNASP